MNKSIIATLLALSFAVLSSVAVAGEFPGSSAILVADNGSPIYTIVTVTKTETTEQVYAGDMSFNGSNVYEPKKLLEKEQVIAPSSNVLTPKATKPSPEAKNGGLVINGSQTPNQAEITATIAVSSVILNAPIGVLPGDAKAGTLLANDEVKTSCTCKEREAAKSKAKRHHRKAAVAESAAQ